MVLQARNTRFGACGSAMPESGWVASQNRYNFGLMSILPTMYLPDEAATRRLGAVLTRVLAPGDVLALDGDLGAGKTTLARGLIQSFLGRAEPVPSPTFTLLQTYESGPTGVTVWHFDLYRLTDPQDVLELGWDDACATGICLVEWPERAGHHMPESALWLHLADQAAGRSAVFDGNSSWPKRLNGLAEGLAA